MDEIKASPTRPGQELLGKIGQVAEKLGIKVEEAMKIVNQEGNSPAKAFIMNMLVSEPLKSAGTALQDWTGTPRDATEDYPYRRLLTGEGMTASLDPRILDVASIAGFAASRVAHGVKHLPTDVMKAATAAYGPQATAAHVVKPTDKSRALVPRKNVLERIPELTEGAKRLGAGEMGAADYSKLVSQHKPVYPYESVPEPASVDDAIRALTRTSRERPGLPSKESYFGVPSKALKEGDPVGIRLDIPSYEKEGAWIATIHGPQKGRNVYAGAGPRIGYEPFAAATDVSFMVQPKAAMSIAQGGPKGTIATMEGKWKPLQTENVHKTASEYMKDPEWIQVGMDPTRHSYFYDRKTMQPVVGADEVIQVGPLVLARKPRYADPKDFPFKGGGPVHKQDGGIMEAIEAAKMAGKPRAKIPLGQTVDIEQMRREIEENARRVAQVKQEFEQERLSRLPPAEMKAYDPSPRQQVGAAIQSVFSSLGAPISRARELSNVLTGGTTGGMSAIDVTPIGAGFLGQEGIERVAQNIKEGNYGTAALESVMAALDVLPGSAAARSMTKPATSAAKKSLKPAVKSLEDLPYETAQEGPFYRVRPRAYEESGYLPFGTREAVGTTGAAYGRSAGNVVPKFIPDEQVDELISRPDNFVRKSADQYAMEKFGRPYELPEMPESSLLKQGPIGRVFELAATDNPQYKDAVFGAYLREMPDVVEQAGAKNYDELMSRSYEQLAKETEEQFKRLPLNLSYHRAGEGNYESSRELLKDVYGNKHMYVYQGGDPHDFLNKVDPDTGLNTNEMFRAVHDFYGHAVHGNQFGPKGEEIAWGAHSQMFSPLARLAMSSETRGQNSFVNYTPINAELKSTIAGIEYDLLHAKKIGDKDSVNRLNALKKEVFSDFKFAPQKSVLLPPEFLRIDYNGGIPNYLQPMIKPAPETATSMPLTHFSFEPNLSMTDPTKFGEGAAGREVARLKGAKGAVGERTYFYPGEPGSIERETQVGPYRYRAEASKLYDVSQDPLKLVVLAREANRSPFTSNVNPGIVYRGDAMTDLERLAKEYGYEGILNPNAIPPMAMTYKPMPVQRHKKGGRVSMDAMRLAVGGMAGGGIKESPTVLGQEFFGRIGQLMERFGIKMEDAMKIVEKEGNSPVKAFLGKAVLSDMPRSVGTALQDWTGTPRDATEDYPYRRLMTGKGMTAQFDPRIVDVAPIAGSAASRVAHGIKHLPTDVMRAAVAAYGPKATASPIDVWHGGPHRFPPTKKNPLGEFDPTKIGTGEGAQAYGHGHYLAENTDVARSYKNKLSKPDFKFKSGLPNPRNYPGWAWQDLVTVKRVGDAIKRGNDPFEYISAYKQSLSEKLGKEGINQELINQSLKTLNRLEKQLSTGSAKFVNPGSLYKVDLPDEQIAKMLDWDKPLSEQPESVQKVLKNLSERDAKMYGEGGGLDYYMGDPESFSGEDVYRYITEQLGGKPQASSFFNEAGIPGVKYFDAASRRAREGTRNFVVFPGGEDILTIKERMKDGGPVKMQWGGIARAGSRMAKYGKHFEPSKKTEIFIGWKSPMWNAGAGRKALELEKAGVDPVDIWKQTGTFRSPDGELRQEISDAGSKFRGEKEMKDLAASMKQQEADIKQKIKDSKAHPDLFPKQLKTAQGELRQQAKDIKARRTMESGPEYGVHIGNRAEFALEHPELYEAYPLLSGMDVQQGGRYGSALGGYSRGIHESDPGMVNIYDRGLANDPRSTMIHEAQHAIQNIEGWGRGGNPEMAFQNPEAHKILENLRNEALKPMTYEEFFDKFKGSGIESMSPSDAIKHYELYKQRIPEKVKQIDRELQSQAAQLYYERLAGEAESRAAQARRDLTPEQRLEKFPLEVGDYGYDVKPEDIIVKRNKKGGQVSLDAMRLAVGGGLKSGIKAAKKIGDYVDPKSSKINKWKWRPLGDVQKDIGITEIPEYIQGGFGDLMADQLKRANAGDLSARDFLKAYGITQSSIGREGRSYNTATKAGLKLPKQDYIRPEGAFAEWLGSKAGQRFLDKAEQGVTDENALKQLREQFSPFGMSNALTDRLRWGINYAAENPDIANKFATSSVPDYRDLMLDIKGIGPAKSGFIGSMLGRGDLPTLDARQVLLHTGKYSSHPDFAKFTRPVVGGKPVAANESVDRLIARQEAMDADIDEALEPFYQHLMHHAVWDKAGGSKTTHEDLVRAMKDYKKGGEVSIDAMRLAVGGMAGGGRSSLIRGGIETVSKGLKSAEKAKQYATPAKFERAPAKTKAEVEALAQRMAPQFLGEFVRKPESTFSVAGKSMKQYKREKDLPIVYSGERPTPGVFDIEKHKGEMMVGVPGDPTIAHRTLEQIGDIKPETPVRLYGGPLYGLEGEFWASGKGPATGLQAIAQRGSEAYGGVPVLGQYIRMPEGTPYALHTTDALLQFQRPDMLGKKKLEQLNAEIRRGNLKNKFPEFVGFEDPDLVLLQAQDNPNLRKHINNVLLKPTTADKYGLYPGSNIDAAITEAELRNLETGATGFSVGRLYPRANLTESAHPTYELDIPGRMIGQTKYPQPYELSFPDTLKFARENLKPKVGEFGMFKMSGPRQIVDAQLIDEIKMYEEAMKRLTGKKKGGSVKLVAGGAVSAAQKLARAMVEAGKKAKTIEKSSEAAKKGDLYIPPSIKTDVNELLETPKYKEMSEGGQITSDDLILEERAL